jgi:hypothetical protein
VSGTRSSRGWTLRIVNRLVDLLEASGLALGAPYSSAIKGASFALRELRGQGRPIRVFYVSTQALEAVLLIGGDKTGDNRFCPRGAPKDE